MSLAGAAGGILAGYGAHAALIAKLAFWGMFIAFAVKVPVFPFHTWLPDAHVEAPTPISVILAGILLKLGGYGMLRINFPFFPDILADQAVWLGILGVISIVYGALVAMAQTDFKKMVAYSSVSHMGFCIIGFASLTTEGMNGAILQLFNHGTISGLLFLVVGVVYDRAHHRDLNRFGGIMWQMPLYATIATITIFASVGLPGLSGFWGEFLAFVGSFQGGYSGAKLLTVIATLGLVFTAAYYLRAIQKVFLGKTNPACAEFPDASPRETWSMIPLLVPTIFLGIYPAPLIAIFQPSVSAILNLPG
jgi:NADH-quinone oxidoreductase subunit M